MAKLGGEEIAAAESSPSWELDGQSYGKPRALTQNSSTGLASGGGTVRDFHNSSLRTEPDMDTIMPLRASARLTNVVSPSSSEEVRTFCL